MKTQNLLFVALSLAFLGGCAVQSNPQGGPRDETPPAIVRQSPAVGELSFTGHEAVVVFDEYIEERNLRSRLVSSPPIPELKYEVSGKRVVLNWPKDALRENTTYRIDLGDCIGDLNEYNQIPSLQFVWSTGATIDSLRLDGQLVGGTAAELKELSIWLLPAGLDSLVAPTFSTKSTDKGGFSFTYLPLDTFDVLVFNDLNFDRRWDSVNENFGFLKNIAPVVDSVVLELPFQATRFATPPMDTLAMDSVRGVLDTLVREDKGTLSFMIPPHDVTAVLYLVGENGWWQQQTQLPSEDSTVVPFGTLVPGKYTLTGYLDENNNDSWDGASWQQGTKAEPLVPVQSLELKANWDLEQPLKLLP